MNEFFMFAWMSGLLIVVHAQFVIVLLELQKLLSQELECLYNKTATVVSEWTVPKSMDVSLLYFYCIRNKYIV